MGDFRPKLNSHEDIFLAIQEELNKNAVTSLNLTTIVKICGERAFLSLFPDRKNELLGLQRQRYEKIDF